MTRKPLFDTIRRILDRPLTQCEVARIDDAADFLPQDCVPGVPGSPSPMTIGADGIALIKRFEGCARKRRDGMVEAYPDPGTGGAPWTIGWGATGPGIGPGTVWTQDACDARLEADLDCYAREVTLALGDAPVTRQQFDALVSFHYNTGAIATATLTRKHKAGDFEGAAREFTRWRYAGGRVMKGLARRRAAEEALYRRGTR
ncbi:lysozyme [Aurantiacibacter zhengii]|uniref:Lysozyme n=1 Tax=Aurantiacibacter zhengii TaxID=2307003 RepID=A0A418NV17_9SPHN|nr:lysozyme [Aurantiacibacter zhengii]RIV87871.1 lysozyme [Aurantiacibacter zhengii]